MLNFFKTLTDAWFFSLMISCVDSGSFRFLFIRLSVEPLSGSVAWETDVEGEATVS